MINNENKWVTRRETEFTSSCWDDTERERERENKEEQRREEKKREKRTHHRMLEEWLELVINYWGDRSHFLFPNPIKTLNE